MGVVNTLDNNTIFYTSGQFAKKAHVSVRTIRFYDQQNVLKPAMVDDSGARYYTDDDFVRLQQILLFKYLGFSLAEIKSMTINNSDNRMLLSSLKLQQKLIRDKIEQLELVSTAIDRTTEAISTDNSIDWDQMLTLIHLTGMQNSLKTQYLNASNISARINLHQMYSTGNPGWFEWIYDNCNIVSGMNILEAGCGSGTFWSVNQDKIPLDIHITVTDISEGMVRDARRNISQSVYGKDKADLYYNDNLTPDFSIDNTSDTVFNYAVMDCCDIPYPDDSFDIVIANHVLFYCNTPQKACQEIQRILKPGGHFICSTYSSRHMQEISALVKDFDERIVLSADNLYTVFGLDNGADILKPFFKNTEKIIYNDSLIVDKAEPLIEYIMSCHGNQNQYLLDRYSAFKSFVNDHLKRPMHITKEAGIFVCTK